MSDTILESLKNAQTLQEVAILLNEVKPYNGGGLHENSTAQEYVTSLDATRNLLMRKFKWRLYGKLAPQFDNAYTSIGIVATAIDKHGVLL
jgi:hypothetical protein